MKEHVKIFKQKLNKARKLNIASAEAQKETIDYVNNLLLSINKDVEDDIMLGYSIQDVITVFVSYGEYEWFDELIKLLDNIE